MLNRKDVHPLLAHLDAQEAALLALKSLLHDTGMNWEGDASRNLLHRFRAATDLLQKLDHDCRLLINQLAEKLERSSDQFSLRVLIRALAEPHPTTAEALRRSRLRLMNLRWQVERISATTSWVLSEQRRIRHAVFEHMSGLTDSQRYDASGRTALTPDSMRFGTRS